MATGKDGRRIRVTSVPNGVAANNIRAAWLGCELPLATEVPEEIQLVAEKSGLFVVAKDVALEVLRSTQKMFAVAYWEQGHCSSGFFCFRPEHCVEVQQS
jgi:hypothetical protein